MADGAGWECRTDHTPPLVSGFLDSGGPTDHNRGQGPRLSLPSGCNDARRKVQLFSRANTNPFGPASRFLSAETLPTTTSLFEKGRLKGSRGDIFLSVLRATWIVYGERPTFTNLNGGCLVLGRTANKFRGPWE
jgi:hypothetical protein